MKLAALAICDKNNWVIQELLLVDLAKTQYTRDDKGLKNVKVMFKKTLVKFKNLFLFILIVIRFGTFTSRTVSLAMGVSFIAVTTAGSQTIRL